jgi:tetratricopeptide (TPR) repeat protein
MLSRIVDLRSLASARDLARRPAAWVTAAALLAAGLASGSLPLLDAPGWELGMAGSVLATLLGAPVGLAAARLERPRLDSSPAAAAGAAFLLLAGLLAVPFAASALRAALGPCRALAAAGFYPLLALPSAALAASVGVAAGFAARGRALPAALLYAAAVALSLLATLAAAWRGPAAFASDLFLGYWPGPLYDEALAVDARLVLGRLEALALAGAVAAAAEALVRRAGRRPALVPALALLAAAGALGAAGGALGAMGLAGDRETLARTLGGRRSGPACTVVYPGEKPPPAAAALLAECEFQAADVARALGLPRSPPLTVYVHRSAAEKRRLVGAAGTDFAKPWLGEIHVLDAVPADPALRHEIVHAVGAAIAGGPLGVPARAGVMVSAGLVEGLAVALDLPRGAWTVHEWSRALRDQGRLPDVAGILGPAGFFRAAPARAYTAAGSFLRWLLDTRGPGPVAELYRTGDFEASLGAPAATLAAEWSRFLDGVAVPPALATAAAERFARPSLFERRCAREAAALEADAAADAASGRAEEACEAWRRASALSGSAWPLRAAGDALARAGDLDGAERAYREARGSAAGDRALAVALASAEGDLAWRRGDRSGAAERWREALAGAPDRADARLLEAKLLAASDPTLAGPALPWLTGSGDPTAALVALGRSPHPLAAYLVGRALLSRGEAAAAVADLARAVAADLPPPIALEARFLLGEARCASGDRAGGEAVLRAVAEGGAAADRERAEADLRRCAFDARAAAR